MLYVILIDTRNSNSSRTTVLAHKSPRAHLGYLPFRQHRRQQTLPGAWEINVGTRGRTGERGGEGAGGGKGTHCEQLSLKCSGDGVPIDRGTHGCTNRETHILVIVHTELSCVHHSEPKHTTDRNRGFSRTPQRSTVQTTHAHIHTHTHKRAHAGYISTLSGRRHTKNENLPTRRQCHVLYRRYWANRREHGYNLQPCPSSPCRLTPPPTHTSI